jgi:hypothetical protein
MTEKSPYAPYSNLVAEPVLPIPVPVPEEVPVVPVVPEETVEPVPVEPVVDLRKKNELNITKVTTTVLTTFEIKIIRVLPNCCCSVVIVINTSNEQIERTVNSTSDDVI